MKRKDDYITFSLADIGSEMVRASKFEGMYYELLEKYEELQDQFSDSLTRENAYHQQMLGDFLELALNKAEKT